MGYVSEIDQMFSNIPKTIRSSTTKRTRAWRVFHLEKRAKLAEVVGRFFLAKMDIQESALSMMAFSKHWCRLGFHCIHPGSLPAKIVFKGIL